MKSKAAIKSLICILAVLALAGCNRTFQESQLVGSWKLDNPAVDVRFTYYPNHTWVMIVASPDGHVPSGAEFGSWKLAGNHITAVTHSGLDNKTANKSETVSIITLNDSVLVLAGNGTTKTLAFHKSGAPAATVSDKELARKLAGKWIFSYTNAAKAMGVLLYSAYQPDGTAHWRGTIYKGSAADPAPDADGTWLVQNGYIVTAITNSESSRLLTAKASHDQILSVTDSQFTYKDEQGSVQKVFRKE